MIRSTCCDAEVLGNEVDPICSGCKEHCDVYNDEIADNELLNGNNKQEFDPRESGI